MKFLEKDLEQIIFESEKSKLHQKGLSIQGHKFRQLRIGNYGIADLVTIDRPYYHEHLKCNCKGTITVYELKQQSVSVSAFFQAVRYVKGLQRYIIKNKPNFLYEFNFKIVLIGSKQNNDVVYLNDLFHDILDDEKSFFLPKTSVNIFTYDYDIDGIIFKQLYGYKLTDEGF